MYNFWLIARHEYSRVVFRRAFVLLTIAIPLGIAAVMVLAIVVERLDTNSAPIGYVDHSGLLDATRASPEGDIAIQPFTTVAAATAALENKEIQAFFVLPDDYPAVMATELYYLDEPPAGDAWRAFDNFVRRNLLARYPADVATRLFDGSAVTVHDVVSSRRFSEASLINIVLPFVASAFFFIATMLSSGYMLEVVADEKENRTMEIMMTTVTPFQLIGGKAIGLMAATISQLVIYLGALAIGLVVARPYVPALQGLHIEGQYAVVVAAFFFPAYVLIAALMIAVGSLVTNLQQGQQIAGVLNFFFMAPLFFLVILFENPSHPLIVFSTFFPTTAFLTIMLRWGVGSIPLLHVSLSWLLLVATDLLMLWVAARLFRLGMLRYGRPLNLRSAVAALGRRAAA